ncbi:non-hydrolyzing UDP-N-acetylglucosamine 2-epimerase [Paenibacillus sp. UNC451MF]|uniref:non-hydrolyzing UDP-N-acetylglucosamine 2-epimerase n=1 Tax=Paenibacillus sp. UNC451MF TaxID=1449063 RepID=UPI00048DAF43|nr:UDP-N-acetylglucosamine 2-epimerase (non-hydrolyzing) [Paenibacillus sp. UNC451MF]
MKKKKIMLIFGTRPEATKMCPVVQELRKYPEWFETKVVVTGQHREQLQQPLSHFKIIPDIDLDLMKENQTLAYFTSAAIKGLDQAIAEDKPDMILVHGDTQTALCGSLVAFFHQIPVGHVEAGLRSHNKWSPWPEEVNRRMVDVVTDVLFAPTSVGRDNLLREGFSSNQIFVTGQTAVDAAILTKKSDYTFQNDSLNKLIQHPGRIVTITAHRRENLGEPMRQMFSAIRRLADDHPDVMVIYPVHLNPAVREIAIPILSGHERIHLLEPIEYPDMINLLSRSYLILSDSGGIQEETTVFNKPLVLMRDTTERPEAIEANAVVLAGTDELSIYDNAAILLQDPQRYLEMANVKNPFGDGHASKRIALYLAYYFGQLSEQPEPFYSHLTDRN